MELVWAPFMFCGGALISVVGFAFWLWMLVECLTREPSEGNDKLIWALVIIFVVPPVGAAVYFFIRRPERIQQIGR
jgi:hypothetical protein